MSNANETKKLSHDDMPPLFLDEVARRDDIAATAPVLDAIAHDFGSVAAEPGARELRSWTAHAC